MACSAVLLKPNVANILLFKFCEQKFVSHGPITIAIDCNGLSLFVYEKNGPIMPLDQNRHQTVIRFGCVSFSMYACGFFVPQMRQICLFSYLQDQSEFHLKRYWYGSNLCENEIFIGHLAEISTDILNNKFQLLFCSLYQHILNVPCNFTFNEIFSVNL